MTRTLAHSLDHVSRQEGWDFKLWSLYDSRYDLMAQYLPQENYVGFGRAKAKLGMKTLTKAIKADNAIREGVNTFQGHVTYPAVAQSQARQAKSVAELL